MDDQANEEWAADFRKRLGFSPVLVVPDPARSARKGFAIFGTGPDLLRFADGLNGFRPSWPHRLSDEHRDLVSAFFNDLGTWTDSYRGRNSSQARLDVARILGEHMAELAEAGFVVRARDRYFILTGGRATEPLSWRILDVEVARGNLAQVIALASHR